MRDLDRGMRYFVVFALGTAVVLPVLGEVYANVSRSVGLVLVTVWALWVGVKFSSLSLKSAMLGITSYFFSSAVLSIVGYVIIHPAVKSWLEKVSEYFSLSITDFVKFWGAAFGLLLLAYPLYFVRLGFRAARRKLSANSLETAAAVDNAFSENEQ